MQVLQTAVVNNCNAKIVAKLITNDLTLLRVDLVSPGQSGFTLGCSTSHNLHILFALLNDLDPELDAFAVSLDATKAFDSLGWHYLFTLLAGMGVFQLFMEWTRLLYTELQPGFKLIMLLHNIYTFLGAPAKDAASHPFLL